MAEPQIFVEGLIFKKPHEKAPEFIRGKISVKVEDFVKFAQEHQKNGWINVELKLSKEGKYYFTLDTWEPKKL